MNRHLLWINGIGALVDIDRQKTTSGDYGQIFDAMKEQSGVRDHYAHAEIVDLDMHQCKAGVFWDWELAGPDGASYRIHVLPDISEAAVDECKEHIRRSYDCVRLIQNRIRRSIDFKIPELKHEEANMYQESK